MAYVFLTKWGKQYTHCIPCVVVLVYVFDTDRRVDVLHLYVRGGKVQIPLALAQDLNEGALDESFAVEIDGCVPVAGFVALQVVVLRVDQVSSVQGNGEGYLSDLSEAAVPFRVQVRGVDGGGFVRPEQVDFVVGVLFQVVDL